MNLISVSAFEIALTTSCFFFIIYLLFECSQQLPLTDFFLYFLVWLFNIWDLLFDRIPIERTGKIPIGFKGQQIVPGALVQQSI